MKPDADLVARPSIMDSSSESLMFMSQHQHMQVSPYLSTQINRTICSCRCGCGCNCAGHGYSVEHGKLSSGESSTIVDSAGSESDERFPFDREMQKSDSSGDESDQLDGDIVAPHAVSYHGLVWLQEQVGELPAGWQQTSFGVLHNDDLEDATNSLFNEPPKTDSRSNAISEHGNLQRLSPGPGIGALFVPDGTKDIDLVYYFDVRPLRLSAEFEHARGKAKEHLLIPDEESFETFTH